MKKLICITLISFLCITQLMHSQNLKTDSIFNWGQSGWELPADMIFDANGNYYITGSFSGEMNISGQQLKSNGKRDLFLAKFSSDNQFIWGKNLGGEGDDNAYSLLFSGDKIYLAGSFRKQIEFNNAAISLKGKGLTDVFIAQLENDGMVKWAKALTSGAPAQKAFLQADSAGNIWIAGSFSKPIETTGNIISNIDKNGVYLAGFDPSGSFLQSSSFTGTSEIGLNGFNIDKADNFCLAGSYTNNIEISGQSLISKGKTDGFLVKLDKEGKALWMKSIGGEYDDEIKSLALDAEGNLYAAGEFKYSMQLDKTFTAKQNTDIFIVKYNPKGEINWSDQLGAEGESYNTVTDIEMAANGKFFVSGAFRGKLQNNPEVKSEGNSKNAFLARYSTNGKKDWVLGTGSKNENKLWINYNHKNKGLFISGYFSEAFKLGDFEIKNKNYKDIFFGSLVDCDLAAKVALGKDTTLCTDIELEAKGEFPYYLWSTGQSGKTIQPKQSDKYTVMATDKHGCQSADTVKVQMLPAPKFELGTDETICKGQCLNLEAPKGYKSYVWDNDSTYTQRVIRIEGKYWLTVKDSIGCETTDSLTLTLNPLPEFDLGETIELPAEDSLNLEPMLAAGNYTYQWSTGYTGEKLSLPMKNFESPTIISLTVTDQNGCSFMDNTLVAKSGSFSEELNQNTDGQGGYKLFPNPTSGKFYILSELSGQANQIDIYNMSGMLVKRIKDIQNFPVEVNLTGIGKGTYLIKLSEQDLSREFRIVIE